MDKKVFKHIDIGELNDDRFNRVEISEYLNSNYNMDIQLKLGPDHLKEKVPDNFCLYPFISMNIDPDGRARPCCKYKVGDSGWSENVPKMPESNLDELWNQQDFQDLRGAFLRNERPDGCRACWNEEAAGIKSMRKTLEDGGKAAPYATFFSHIVRQSPKNLDLKLSNLCNLKCRICTPFLSSQWVKEYKDLNLVDQHSLDLYSSNHKEKLLENNTNLEILKKWAPHIKQIEFYGGEPLLQQEHDRVLEIIYNEGLPEKTDLFYNTNCTICDEKFFKLWNKFKCVTISLSVDDIGERFEYQRKNAKWKEVIKNIELFKQHKETYNVKMNLQLYITIGVLNAFYLPEIILFLKTLNLPVVFNLIHYPRHFSLVNLPVKAKKLFEQRLLMVDCSEIEVLDWSATIESIINYMNGAQPSAKEYENFFNYINIHDKYRKESFKHTFPELYEVLK